MLDMLRQALRTAVKDTINALGIYYSNTLTYKETMRDFRFFFSRQ